MKMKKYLILVIVSLSILIVLWLGRLITGETGLSAKEKKNDSNLTALQKLALSAKRVWPDGAELLQGLEGVFVSVVFIQPKAEKYGLTKKALQTDTKLQLRQYGIKVLTKEEFVSTPEGPCLFINVNVDIREEIPTAAAVIRVELREAVLLLREPTRIYYSASTWQRDSVLLVGLDRIKYIRESVKDLVNDFIYDYLAANPKEQSTTEKDKKPKDD